MLTVPHVGPGTGFATFQLPPPLNTVTLGICMDLNVQPPSMWTIESGPYELADHCAATRSNLLVLLNAWKDSGRNEDAKEDWETLNFWSLRLQPLWDDTGRRIQDDSPMGTTTVVVCNRCGDENGNSNTSYDAVVLQC